MSKNEIVLLQHEFIGRIVNGERICKWCAGTPAECSFLFGPYCDKRPALIDEARAAYIAQEQGAPMMDDTGKPVANHIDWDATALAIMRDKAESFGRALDERDATIAELTDKLGILVEQVEIRDATIAELRAEVARLHAIINRAMASDPALQGVFVERAALNPTSNERDG